MGKPDRYDELWAQAEREFPSDRLRRLQRYIELCPETVAERNEAMTASRRVWPESSR